MNICSNQIKEVILHRFKVNSLQKLLIHINFLLAFSVLFCSHSAFGQSANPAFGSNTQYQNLDAGNGVIVTVMTDDRAVDLGLSVYWAKYNIGTTDDLAIGDYFAWGETTKRTNNYDWDKYSFTNYISKKVGLITIKERKLSKYTTNSSYSDSSPDNNKVLDPEDDAAHVQWGGYWRMPTHQDFVDLLNTSHSTQMKKYPYYITFTNNSNSIIIRCAGFKDGTGQKFPNISGYYWSSSLDTDDNDQAYCLTITGSNLVLSANTKDDRRYGYTIRPVIDKCDNIWIKVKFTGSTPSETILVSGVDYPKGTVLHAPSIDCYDYEWQVAGSSLNAVKNKDIEITSTNVTYSLVYIIKQYNVTAYSNDQANDQVIGTISPVSKTVNCGESVTLTATPAVCYKLSRWVDLDDSSIVYEPGNSNDEYSCTTNADGTCTLIIKNVRRAMKVKAEFVLKKSNVTIEANPEDGGLVEFAN